MDDERCPGAGCLICHQYTSAAGGAAEQGALPPLAGGVPTAFDRLTVHPSRLEGRVKFDDYQEWARTTSLNEGCRSLSYLALGLNGEAGEVADKIKKTIRDHDGVWNAGRAADVAQELGDVLWYLARLADELGFDLSEVAHQNRIKLICRQVAGTISGSGDNR